jgi:hypothetical protein
MYRRTAALTTTAAIALTCSTLVAGCLEHPLKEVEYSKVQVPTIPIVINDNRDVDILFIIDNSGSMAEEQARLAKNFPTFIDALAGMGADYRIGITTTDVAHPGCGADGTPEDGALVLRSCTEAVAAGAFKNGGTDAQSACTDQCTLSAEQLALRPGADGKTHPWLESTRGATNLQTGVAMAEAFACYGPQGIDGCGFESPLEAMKLAIEKARGEGGSGFMRDEALLSVVLVTDETDCSATPSTDIFTTNDAFWNDETPRLSSSTCWRAGVACTGAGPDFTECHAQDYSAEGEPGVSRPEDAALRPIDGYIDFLAGLRADTADIGDTGPHARDVLMSLIAGVPVGYDLGATPQVFVAAEPGSEQALTFGIAPGCINTEDGSNSAAVPPVREREVAEAFADGARNVYSICQDDYSPALAQIAVQIKKVLAPSCAGVCIADSDTDTPELEPECSVHAVYRDGRDEPLRPCLVEDGAWATPADVSVCFYLLTDADHSTESMLDDMTIEQGIAACSTDTSNLEFKILRTGPRTPGVSYSADCVAAADVRSCER